VCLLVVPGSRKTCEACRASLPLSLFSKTAKNRNFCPVCKSVRAREASHKNYLKSRDDDDVFDDCEYARDEEDFYGYSCGDYGYGSD
jgi:hypothetical protein